MRRLLLFVLALSYLGTAGDALAAGGAFRVIVNHQVKGSQISRGALSSIFLKRAPKWGDGSAIVPVDQSVRSDVRKTFSGDVLSQGIVEVQLYWQRRMSVGIVPPPVKPTDDEVVAFVASTPGAIGYVSVAAVLPDTVRPIELTD